jgi:glycosyltransferase involved in cell wall biosynthesis
MALGTPIVSTTKGAEGLELEAGTHLLLADDPGEFAAQTVRLLRDPALRQLLAANALQFVRQKYGWADIGQRFCQSISNLRLSV